MNGIGILPHNHLSYVDHIVPLCQIMGIPLLVTDSWIKAVIEIYYPPMDIVLAEIEEGSLDPYLEGVDYLLYVDFFRREKGFAFHQFHSSKPLRSVISLHGNPDKYRTFPWIEQLKREDIVLSYGPQLHELLAERGIEKEIIPCGNYRLAFYKKHEAFFDERLPFKKTGPTLLYAPTWSAHARSETHSPFYSPFFFCCEALFDHLASRFQLLVKLHPHMVKLMGEQVDQVMERYSYIHFLNDLPLIYPLLKHSDLYFGDYSSIGYDFLYFDRPLYFFETDSITPLHSYGRKVKKEELSSWEAKIEPFNRKEGYRHAFGEDLGLEELQCAIYKALTR